MNLDIEHGILNKVFRAFAAFVPLKQFKRESLTRESLTLASLARRYARGNVRLQMGKVVANPQYQERRSLVLKHDFLKI